MKLILSTGLLLILFTMGIQPVLAGSGLNENTGYFLVHSDVDNGKVYFIDSNGQESFMGLINQGELRVLVNLTAIPFLSYRIETVGYPTFTNTIDSMPLNGETVDLWAQFTTGTPVETPKSTKITTITKKVVKTPATTISRTKVPTRIPTSKIVYVTVLVTPKTTVTPTQDPIIGVWRNFDDEGFDIRYRFDADGAYAYSSFISDEEGTVAFTGTWKAQGSNTYQLRDTALGTISTIKYNSAQNAIYNTKYNLILLTPFQGDVEADSYRPLPDPIIGVWRYSDSNGYDFRYRFDADGKAMVSTYNAKTGLISTFSGTWKSQGGNSYVFIYSDASGEDMTIYDPSKKVIYDSDYPAQIYYPFQGDVRITSKPTSSPTYSSQPSYYSPPTYLFGNGDDVISFTASGSGLRIFNMKHTGSSNFIVTLKDGNGGYVDLLANEIGSYSGKNSETLTTGTYFLDIKADGAWTIEISSA